MLSREEVRSVDRVAMEEFAMSGLVLMENAGRGAAEEIFGRFPIGRREEPTRVVILCGGGNNGGDGYVIARHLELLGFDVKLVSLVPIDRLKGDAAANAAIAQCADITTSIALSAEQLENSLGDCEILVDCLLGTGAQGEPRGIYRDAIVAANAMSTNRVAVDIPSGLDCDTGLPSGTTFRADLTISFVDLKKGVANPEAEAFLGEVRVVGIGVPKALLNRY